MNNLNLSKHPTESNQHNSGPLDAFSVYLKQGVCCSSPAESCLKRFVRDELLSGLKIKFDRTIIDPGAMTQASSLGDLSAFMVQRTISVHQIMDHCTIALAQKHGGTIYKHREIRAAVNAFVADMRQERKRGILLPLYQPLSDAEGVTADHHWAKLASLFDMPPNLAVAVISQLMWLVKAKFAGLPVKNHIMPIVFGADQGSGKTTFVRMLVGPLEELASADMVLSDFTDKRSGDIYEYAVAVVDDMEHLQPDLVPRLKNLITAVRINRRRLATSSDSTVAQMVTLIGTANKPVYELIKDPTGHRRFVSMPFRNGNVAKGGDVDVWETVDAIDYRLLWRSVEVLAGASPLSECLSELYAYQSKDVPKSAVHAFLLSLNLSDPEVKGVMIEGAGERSDMLRDLYIRRTGDPISRQKFAVDMLMSMNDPDVPFDQKEKKVIGATYRLRTSHRLS